MWLVSLNLVIILLFFAIPRAKQKLPCEVATPRIAHESEEVTVTAAPERNVSAELEEVRVRAQEAMAKVAKKLEDLASKAEAQTLSRAEAVKAEALLVPAPKVDVKSCSFVVDPCMVTSSSAQAFDKIYARNVWGSRSNELGTHTRSGLGSDMKGAFDWITQLSKFFVQYPELQTIADIPSGDIGWQMAVRHFNTVKLYFGGDIAKSVAQDNARRFKDHAPGLQGVN